MKMVLKFGLIFLSTLWLAGSLMGKEFRYLHRSPKALLMGDAYTAIADDEFTLFYNPAGLGKHSGFSMGVINPEVGVSNLYEDRDRFENFPENDPVAISDRVMGVPLHIHAGATPYFKLESFGLNVFGTMAGNFALENSVHPVLNLDYRFDRGFIVGYAFSIGKGAKKRKGRRAEVDSGKRVTFGLALKNVTRDGLDESFDLFGLELFNRITDASRSENDMDAIRESLGYARGQAWGGDVGVEFAWGNKNSLLTAAASLLDVGNTTFTRDQGTRDLPEQEMILNTGVAWSQDFTLINYKFALDLHPVNVPMPTMRKLHVGAELGIPFVSVLWGMSAGYMSYGAEVRFWPIKLYGGFYSVELGNKFREKEGKRAIIYLSLIDFSFDA